MPLIRIQRDKGIKQVFIAAEGIADLASVELVAGERQVSMGATGHEHLAAGVARGSASSGDLVRVITDGIVSGVKIASGYTVAYGDRLTIATSGQVVPLNTLTANLISGGGASGALVIDSQFAGTSGILTGVNTGINTGRVLGKALTSGGSGMAAIQMLVSLG